MLAIIIDDSRAMRGIIKRVLKGMGFDTLEAPDGQAALALLAESPRPDLALVDWNMPNMNGYEFVKAVRANRAFDEMKMTMVTTEIEITQITLALEAGANEYLMKPFTEEAMRDKIGLMGFGQEAA